MAGVALTTLALSAGPSSQAQSGRSLFGVVEPQNAPALASELGVGWGRVRFNWAEVQPNGPDEWREAEITDAELANEWASGREVVGLLIGIPAWAVDERGLPRGLYAPPDSPDNTWGSYVRLAVSRYRGQINHWVIWNEPDVWDPAHPGFTWPGTEADFAQLLRVAYLVARQENPDVVIHLGAMSHWWDALYGRELYIRRLLRVLASDPGAVANNYYYDVLTLHLYFHPAGIYELIETYAAIQREFGLDKPIWLVETNAAPSGDPAWPVASPTFDISLQEQAAFMPQALALALAAGVQRIAIYKLIDTPGDYAANPEPFGLVRIDGSRRPAFTTARVAIDQLAGAQRATWIDRGAVSRVVVEGTGWVTSVLWTRIPSPQEAIVPAASDSAVLYDMWGSAQTIWPTDGYYRVALASGECQETVAEFCMIGGPPVYLVEEAGSGESAGSSAITASLSFAEASPDTSASATVPTIEPSPSPSSTPTLTPTHTVTATDTPTPSVMPTRTATPTTLLSITPTMSASPAAPPAGFGAFVGMLIALAGAVAGVLVWWLHRWRKSS
jgi:hypothetical protein